VTRALIEEELPLRAVNKESAREKSLRHGHISTLHLWWARRPLAMSRAVVFGTLMPDPGDHDERTDLLTMLAGAASFERSQAGGAALRAELRKAWPDQPPKLLDCFAGGGAIPLEALRLGCEVHALDLNPVAHLVQKCVLDYPQRYGQPGQLGSNPLAEDFVEWAEWVRERVEPKLAMVFPADAQGHRPAIYFWARTMVCPNPACYAEIPLLRNCWLDNSKRRMAWVDIAARPGRIDLRVVAGPPPGHVDPGVGTVKASTVTCPACGTSATAREVREYGKRVGFGRHLYAVLDVSREARTYRSPRPDEAEGAEKLASDLLSELDEGPDGTSPFPDESMVKSQYRRFSNLVYGIDTFRGLFNDRQLYVLGTLSAAVRDANEAMVAGGMDQDHARAVATYLALCIDRIADRDSSFCTWGLNPGGFAASVRNTFPQQAIRMAWNYVEIDPLQDGSGSWNGAIKWIEAAIRHCSSTSSNPAAVDRGDAQHLELEDDTFDAVIVDPPYYDAFQYGDLSDFFYVWLKRSVGHLYPNLFLTPLTPKQAEIIESRADKKSPEYISHDEFEARLQRALKEIARVVKSDGIVSLVFAHTDVEAWERLLRALRAAGLVVTTSWPMRSEMANRSTAQISAVLSSSVVLVCRKSDSAGEGFYDDVVRELEARIADRLAAFEEMQLIGADYFVSAVGPAFEVFARYKRVVRLSGEEVGVDELMVLARQAVARHAIRRLLGGENLSALDNRSLMYLTWRWAYDGDAIPADEAYKLGRAFEIDLADLARPGDLISKTRDSFQLLAPHERKDIKLSATPSLIDVLHLAARYHDTGRRSELAELLGATGMGSEPGFWATATAIAESLLDGNRERTMLLGLTGNKEQLTQAAARHAGTSVDELTLFR
jgi:putative DNA methylase